MKPPVPLLVIVGPTAVGKTDLAIEVAERFRAEIISADSMQVYRGMDIGTAKPTAEQRARVPHHLIDVVDPEAAYSVARFQTDATAAIEEVTRRERLPMLVGGTGLYVHAVVDRWKPPPVAPDAAFRQELYKLATEEGADELHRRLENIDPVTAARVHPHDVKRVIRALEVFHTTRRPLSTFQAMRTPDLLGEVPRLDQTTGTRYNAVVIGVMRPRELLYERIERRIDTMLDAGFLEEVRRLKARGCHRGMTSMQGLGYRHALAYVEGEVNLEEMTRLWKRDTRRFAKRQLTWFRRDSRIRWIVLDARVQSRALDEALQATAILVKPCRERL